MNLTKEQKINLLRFLERVNLTGKEVPTFNELMNIIGKSINEDQPVDKNSVEKVTENIKK